MYLLLYIIVTYGILKYKFIFFTSAEINGSVDCEHGKEQPTNKRFVHIHYPIYISFPVFFWSFLTWHHKTLVRDQKVALDQAPKHAGKK